MKLMNPAGPQPGRPDSFTKRGTRNMKVFFIISAALFLTLNPFFAEAVGAQQKDAKSASQSDEEATKKIIVDLFTACLAGKNYEATGIISRFMPEKEKKRRGKETLDYAEPADKKEVDEFCYDIDGRYANGYEFGRSIRHKSGFGWEIFPIAEDKGQIYYFGSENDNYVLLDIDRIERKNEP
jgi:hypothetical protein